MSSTSSSPSSEDVVMKASSSDAAEEPTKGSAFYLSTLQPSTAVVSARAICEGKYLVVGRVASRIQIFGPFGKVGGEDFEAASADVMENGPLLEVPVMGRLMVMEVIRDEFIYFTTAKRQFALWRFRADPTTELVPVCSGMLANLYPYPTTDSCLRASHTVCYDDESGIIATHLFRGQLFVMDIDSILESKNREGERTSSTGQAFRMDSVPDAIDMCIMPPKDGENKRCVNIAVLVSEEPISRELKILFFHLDLEEKTLEVASQNEYPKIDVSERRVRRILALSWQEIVAIGPRTISRYGMAQADDGEVRSDYITTKLMRRVCVGGTIGRLFIVDDEGWLHVLHRSASGGSGSRHYVDDGKRKGNAGKRRRETKVRGDLSGRDGMEMETLGVVSEGASSAVAVLLGGELIFVASDAGDAHRLCRVYPEPYLDTASYVRTIHAELSLSPILDFQLPANTGRDLLMVTGRSEASSIRALRCGLRMKELGSVEWPSVSMMWSIGLPRGSSLLVQSLATTTVVCTFVTKEEESTESELDEPSIWCGGVSNLVVQVSKGAVRWVDVSSSPPVLVRSDEVENGRSFVAATGDGDTVVTVDDCGRAWIRQMKDRGRVETTEVSFGKSLVGVSCVAYDSSSSMLAVGLWPSVGEESSQGKLMLKEIGNRKGRGRFRTPLEIPLGSSRVESSVTRSIVVTSRRSLGMSSAAEVGVVVVCGLGDGRIMVWLECTEEERGWKIQVIDVGGFRPISLSKLPSINGLFVRGTYPYLLTADDEGAELMCRNVNPLQGGVAVECAVEFGEERAFAMSAGQKDSHVAVMALMTSQPSLVFASLSTDEPCEFQTRRRAVGEGQAAMHVEHVTGDMYAVSTITIEERLNEDKGKENTSDNNNRRGASSSSSVRLMNGSSLREIYCIPAEEDVDMPADDDEEEEESTVEVVSLATFNLGDAEDSGIVYLCVGSCVVPAMAGRSETDEAEPSKGFVKVYRIDPTASLLSGSKAEVCEQVATVEVEGVPYQMASMVDAENRGIFLLCTVNNVLEVYAVEQQSDGALRLGLVTKRHLHIASIFMQIRGRTVVIGDMTRGVTLLQFDSKTSTISELARYEFPLWPTAIQFLSNGNILVADDRFNLFIMEKQKEIGGSHSDSRGYSLQTVGQLHLGLLVNCIRPGMLSSTMPPSSRGSNGEHRDEYLLCTIEGAVVSLKGIDDTGIGRMLQIQHAIAVNIHQQSSGSPSVDARVDWKLFRSIDSSTLPSSGGALDPSGFVDGDLLELFLVMADELAVKTANTLCDGTEADELVKEVRGIVDSFA